LRDELESFARTRLKKSDRVALEATTNTWSVVAILRPFVTEVVVGNPLKSRAIAEAKVKTDKVDVEILAPLLRCDYLPAPLLVMLPSIHYNPRCAPPQPTRRTRPSRRDPEIAIHTIPGFVWPARESNRAEAAPRSTEPPVVPNAFVERLRDDPGRERDTWFPHCGRVRGAGR
jgi:hypothetical protein